LNSPGLPDGLLTNQTFPFVNIIKGLGKKKSYNLLPLGLSNDHLAYFGIFCGHLVYFSPCFYQEKSGNPGTRQFYLSNFMLFPSIV
jgi:hypothetical protein